VKATVQEQLRTLVTLYARGQRRCLLEVGLPQHAGLLPMLRKLAPVSQTEFSRAAGFDKSWTSRVLDRFVEDGLVERVVQASDRRCFELRLTAAGVEQSRRIEQILDGFARRLIAQLPPDTRGSVGEVVTVLVDTLRTGAAEGVR
jgi:DNA-binding MarR family transcriptional regulator